MTPEFKQTFFLSAGETDASAEMSLPLLVSRIIDISTAHANALGVGNPSMEALNCGWVLSRLAIEMTRYPKVNSTYSLTTWVETWNRHFSERMIMVSDAEGNPIGYARSIWMVLNYETRENAGLSHLSLPPDMISSWRCPIPRQGKHHPVMAADFPGELPKGALRATHPDTLYKFLYCDLDFYRHVNTVRYIALLMNQFSLDEMDKYMVKRMEIAFMHEGTYGSTVAISRAGSPDDNEVSIAINAIAEDGISKEEEILFAHIDFSSRTPGQ